MALSPEQSRAARGLLGISQADLAKASRVSLRTVQSFETGQRQPTAANLYALEHALEAAGVEFIAANGGGPGVRLRKSGAERGDPS